MNQPIDYRGTWKTRRYEWKRQLGRSQNLSRGAKLLATQLCDNYANHQTARCWPSNRTLADLLGVNVRTIQRYLAELKSNGWLRNVRLSKRRRAMQLVFPGGTERDILDDIPNGANMTNLPPERGNSVAPHDEPKKNLKAKRRSGPSLGHSSYLLVNEDETLQREAWTDWMLKNLDGEINLILGYTKRGDSYCLPSRYPGDREEDRQRYLAFFSAVLSTKGRMLDR